MLHGCCHSSVRGEQPGGAKIWTDKFHKLDGGQSFGKQLYHLLIRDTILFEQGWLPHLAASIRVSMHDYIPTRHA